MSDAQVQQTKTSSDQGATSNVTSLKAESAKQPANGQVASSNKSPKQSGGKASRKRKPKRENSSKVSTGVKYDSKSHAVLLTSSVSHNGKTYVHEDSQIDLSLLNEFERQLVLLGMKVMHQHSSGSNHMNAAVEKLSKHIKRMHPDSPNQEEEPEKLEKPA